MSGFRQTTHLAPKWWEANRFPLAEMLLPRPIARVYSDLQSLNCNSEIVRALKKERFLKQTWWHNVNWTDMNVFIVFCSFRVNIRSVCHRNVDVFDCRVLPQTLLGVLYNIWAIIPNIVYFSNPPKFCLCSICDLDIFDKGIMNL